MLAALLSLQLRIAFSLGEGYRSLWKKFAFPLPNGPWQWFNFKWFSRALWECIIYQRVSQITSHCFQKQIHLAESKWIYICLITILVCSKTPTLNLTTRGGMKRSRKSAHTAVASLKTEGFSSGCKGQQYISWIRIWCAYIALSIEESFTND